MSAAPFAALEDRVNVAAFRRLANALASVGGSAQLPVIFDEAFALGGVGSIGMAGAAPVLEVQDAGLATDLFGAAVLVYRADGTTLRGSYTVAEHVPDGSGVSRLVLERAL